MRRLSAIGHLALGRFVRLALAEPAGGLPAGRAGPAPSSDGLGDLAETLGPVGHEAPVGLGEDVPLEAHGSPDVDMDDPDDEADEDDKLDGLDEEALELDAEDDSLDSDDPGPHPRSPHRHCEKT